MKAIILKTLVIGTAVGGLAALAVSPQANAQTTAKASSDTFRSSGSNAPTQGTSASVGNNPTTAGENVIIQQPQNNNNNNSSSSDSGCCGMGNSNS